MQDIIWWGSTEAVKGGCCMTGRGWHFHNAMVSVMAVILVSPVSDLEGRKLQWDIGNSSNAKLWRKKKVWSDFWSYACSMQDLHFIFISKDNTQVATVCSLKTPNVLWNSLTSIKWTYFFCLADSQRQPNICHRCSLFSCMFKGKWR